MRFPMLLTHREDPRQQIVVATREQYEEAPDCFKPEEEEAPAPAKRGRPSTKESA